MIRSYIKYRRRRKGPFRIHSPFVFEFVTKALKRAHNDDFDKLYSIYRTIDRHRFCPRSKRHKARLIYKTTAYFEPDATIIIGETSAMNVAALSMSCPKAQLHTTTWREAYDELESMGINNIRLVKQDSLSKMMNDNDREAILLLLSDPLADNHLIELTQNDDIVIVDNIHQSHDYEQGWDELKNNPRVSFSFDLYHIGILFFKQGFEKQDFILKYR